MEVLDYLIARLKRGIITFVNMVSLAHRDYPYHDFLTDTMTDKYQLYAVGSQNLGRNGDQHKRFTSKSTLIMTTQEAYVIFNHANNVVQTLRANTWYEFKCNIYQILYRYVDVEGTIDIFTEGVLPQEARRPE